MTTFRTNLAVSSRGNVDEEIHRFSQLINITRAHTVINVSEEKDLANVVREVVESLNETRREIDGAPKIVYSIPVGVNDELSTVIIYDYEEQTLDIRTLYNHSALVNRGLDHNESEGEELAKKIHESLVDSLISFVEAVRPDAKLTRDF